MVLNRRGRAVQAAVAARWGERDRARGPWAVISAPRHSLVAKTDALASARAAAPAARAACEALAFLATWCWCLGGERT